ncbi:MAG: dihydrolipoamide acetyltransferase [Gammaproteobacteria bacterium]|nr:dihydrolipoamide acetyltransferase [Gammaproteobacteria bacterium]
MSNTLMEILIPELGDFSDVEVIEVLVSEGDEVQAEDPLITLETDKATMEVPSPYAGVVKKLEISVGDRVSVGHQILLLDEVEVQEVEAAEVAAEVAAAVAAAEEPVEQELATSSSSSMEILIPELGDFSDVEVIEMLISEGDEVQAEDPLITLETDKATMEVPSPYSGIVKKLEISVGDRVSVGHQILLLDVVDVIDKVAIESGNSLDSKEEPLKSEGHTDNEQTLAQVRSEEQSSPQVLPAIDDATFIKAHATPSVRKLARELGVDLGRVVGTGQKGRVTADNVKAWVKAMLQQGGATGLPDIAEVDFSSFGSIDIEPLSRIQKISGGRLQASWLNLPHVTQHDEADITDLEEIRQKLKKSEGIREAKVTLLSFIVRACVLALGEYPNFRSSLARDGKNLIKKNYFHIGFAVDTPNGLVVPVIHNADQMDIFEIAASLEELSQRAREGKLGSKDMQGGVFTVSSLGGIGGTGFTPIINAPEVAILGVSRSQFQPVYENGEFVARLILPLSLSYDHRVIDGAAAVRFTTYISKLLKDLDPLVEGIDL